MEESREDAAARKSRFIVVSTLCLVNLIANSAYSSIAPFFPGEAVKKHVPQFYIGFIFAGYSVSMWIFSPLFSSLLKQYGRKKVLMLGCLCESFAILLFAILIVIEDPFMYGVSCFMCRMIEGFGNGCLSSSTNSLISFHYED